MTSSIHDRMKALARRKSEQARIREDLLAGKYDGILNAREFFDRQAEAPAPAPAAPELPGGCLAEERLGGRVIVRTVRIPRSGTGAPAALPIPATIDGAVLRRLSPDFAGVESLPLERIAFIDTETTGLVGGTGTLPFLIGVGWWDVAAESLVVEQYLASDFEHEPALIDRFLERLGGFAALATYNGRYFDIPLLRARLVLQRRPPRLVGLPHLDLLHFARRLWRGTLASCSLKTVEREILGLDRGPDINSAEIPALFHRMATSGSFSEMGPVLGHHAHDIATLAGLLLHQGAVIADPLGSGLVSRPGEWAAVSRWMESEGRLDDAVAACGRALELHDGADRAAEEALLMRWALLHKRRRDWEAAVATWRGLMRRPLTRSAPAWIELAKYLEHGARNPAGALEHVERCLRQAVMESELGRLRGLPPGGTVEQLRSDMERRAARLRLRVSRKAAP